LGKKDEAVTDYKQCLALNPGDQLRTQAQQQLLALTGKLQ
jgi:hypothetical protein